MARGRPLEVERELLEAFRQSGRVTEHLVDTLPPAIWRTAPPEGGGRSIAGIVAHIQSVRRSFARMGGARPGPPVLDRRRATRAQARQALRRSTYELRRQFESAITEQRPRIAGMPRRTVDALVYLIQHDAHHRGQICALARRLGHRLERDDVMRMWGWKALPPRAAR